MEEIYEEEYAVRTERDAKTHALLVENWYDSSGRRHRAGGEPAVTKYNQVTGLLEQEEYWEFGVEHRENGPSASLTFTYTGVTIFQEWKVRGRYRDGEIATVTRDRESGEITRASRFENGEFVDIDPSEVDSSLSEPMPGE